MATENKIRIPILDLSPEVEKLWPQLTEAVQKVMRSTQFILGPNVKALEAELASHLSVKHAVGLNSGTDALFIALRALGIGPGDEVITTAFTFFATAEAISHVGATPVFVDIEPHSFNLDADQIEKKVTPRTKAIIPVHLFGHAARMDAVMAVAQRHGLKVVEDVAQAFGGEFQGKKLGSMGDFGAFSFFPSKNLGAYGDGGLITTNEDKLADSARMLRTHGSRRKYYNEVVGYNSRLDEMQAAILRVKLPHVEQANAGRREAAKRYQEIFKGVAGVTTPTEASYTRHVFHQYTVRIAGGKRDAVHKKLGEAGIGTMIYYPVPVHQLDMYKATAPKLPITEIAAQEVLSLPIWPQITPEIQLEVAQTLIRSL